jgi:hypothetical protein
MSVQVKVSGVWRTVIQPWVKTSDTGYRQAVKVFTKVAGTWRESWPLQPGPTGVPLATTSYRNDRIEMDVSWTAPTSGEPVAKYFVTIWISGSSTTYVVNAPATSITLTNNGSGYHPYAGQGATAVVYAQSAAGRNGDSRTSAAVTISQLPAPPAPYSYSVSMWQCALTHNWSVDQGRRVDGVQMVTEWQGGQGGWHTYPKNVGSANYQHWDPNTIPGGWVVCYLRSYGPGGYSGWVTVSGTMPNSIGTSSFRFGDGYLRMYTSGISPAVQIHVLRNGGGWVYVGDFQAGAGEVYDPQSVNYPRDRAYYAMILRPVNNANGWVGRDQFYAWVMKIPNPFYVMPVDTATWRNYGYRSEEHQDFQGSSQIGTNAAFFFYGDQFYDYYSAAAIGYDVGVTGALIAMRREVSGRVGAVSPQLMVHRFSYAGQGVDWGGAVATNALERNQTAWVMLPADWAWYLKERADGWKGVGLFDGDATLLQGLNWVSYNYSIFTAWNYGTIDGGQFWLDTVCVFHNG